MDQIIPNLSVDCCIFGYKESRLSTLLIKRRKQPELGRWSLPGSYAHMHEHVQDAAKRVLSELTGLTHLFVSPIGVFGDPNRYPVERVVSLLYCALINPDKFELKAGAHAEEVLWMPLDEIPSLPFDHTEMVETAKNWLKCEIWNKPILGHLLPEKFPLNTMQDLYEHLLDETIDNRNFRKKVINAGIVEKLDEKTQGGQQRPAVLYQVKTSE